MHVALRPSAAIDSSTTESGAHGAGVNRLGAGADAR